MSALGGCGYPDGFVEPRPEFWKRMQNLAEIASTAISSVSGAITNWTWVSSDLGVHQRQFLTHFSACMATLAGIAEKELAQQPLTAEETEFLKTIVDQNASSYGADRDGKQWIPGWYPRLFYSGQMLSPLTESVPVVADVYTDVPSPGDAGGVLHEATGKVNLLMVAIDNGSYRAIYGGPVASHYEFYEPGLNRLTDNEWRERLSKNQQPAPPEWTAGWLIRAP